MYVRELESKPKEITLQVSGKLWRRSLVMQDVETGTLWSHLLGKAMRGDLEGTRLVQIPSTITTWKAWEKSHPKTTVLAMSRTSREFQVEVQKRPGTFVLGYVERSKTRAYPFDLLLKEEVVNDRFEGSGIVVTFHPGTTESHLFSCKVDDKNRTFTALEPGQMKDKETGSVWNSATGVCLQGSEKGSRLEELPSIISFRRAWDAFHPESSYYGR